MATDKTLDRLINQLNTSPTAKSDQPLWQVIIQLIKRLKALEAEIATATGSGGTTINEITENTFIIQSGGDDGEDGPIGPPGIRGADGAPGATGATGPAGAIGIGLDGQDGDDGYPIPGPRGLQGPTGATGATGATGPQGPIGIGLDGDDGVDGMPVPGPRGAMGPTGATGPTTIGPMGIDGEDGINVLPIAATEFARINFRNFFKALQTFKVMNITPYDNGNSGAAKTIDWALSNTHYLTLDNNCTLTFSNPIDGIRLILLVKGGFTITWPASVEWPAGTAPTISGASDWDLFTFLYKGAEAKYVGSYNLEYSL